MRLANRTGSMRAAFLAALFAISIAPVAAQSVARTIEHQGIARHVVAVNAESGRPRPALVILHGRRDAAAPNRSSPSLDALALKEGFAAIYPAGIDGVWNWPTRVSTQQAPLSKAGQQAADDLGFLIRLIDRLIDERIADPGRIYLSGASMGGFMTFSLICAVPERIAAAAAMIAAMTGPLLAECKPARTVPLMLLNGTLDRLVPFAGQKSAAGTLLSFNETFDFWRLRHGCAGPNPPMIPETTSEHAIIHHRIDAVSCRIDGALRADVVVGGGHTLPTRATQSPQDRERYGPRGTVFETAEEVWSFLARFRL